MSTTVKKYKIQQLQDNNDMLELHPETDADIVNYSKTISGTAVTTVKGALDKIVDGIGVTGVKGNAETDYRTGQVNITPADIGAQPRLIFDFRPTADSDNPVTSNGIYEAIQNAIEIAEGKTSNYVISDANPSVPADYNWVNNLFNSTNATIYIPKRGDNDEPNYIKQADNTAPYIKIQDLKTGDIISITETDVPDRWAVPNYDGNNYLLGVTFYPLETKLNMATSVTSGDTRPVTSGAVYNALNGEFNIIPITFTGVAGTTHYNGTITEAQYNSINNRTLLLINNSDIAQYRGSVPETNYTTHIFERVKVSGNTTLGTRRLESAEIFITKDGNSYIWDIFIYLNTDYFVSNTEKTTWNAKYDKPSGGIPSTDLATSGVTAGTYSAVTVNNKGIATAGGQIVEVGRTNQTTPSASLAVGGIFFKEI